MGGNTTETGNSSGHKLPSDNFLWSEAIRRRILTRGRPPERALSDIAPQHFKARII